MRLAACEEVRIASGDPIEELRRAERRHIGVDRIAFLAEQALHVRAKRIVLGAEEKELGCLRGTRAAVLPTRLDAGLELRERVEHAGKPVEDGARLFDRHSRGERSTVAGRLEQGGETLIEEGLPLLGGEEGPVLEDLRSLQGLEDGGLVGGVRLANEHGMRIAAVDRDVEEGSGAKQLSDGVRGRGRKGNPFIPDDDGIDGEARHPTRGDVDACRAGASLGPVVGERSLGPVVDEAERWAVVQARLVFGCGRREERVFEIFDRREPEVGFLRRRQIEKHRGLEVPAIGAPVAWIGEVDGTDEENLPAIFRREEAVDLRVNGAMLRLLALREPGDLRRQRRPARMGQIAHGLVVGLLAKERASVVARKMDARRARAELLEKGNEPWRLLGVLEERGDDLEVASRCRAAESLTDELGKGLRAREEPRPHVIAGQRRGRSGLAQEELADCVEGGMLPVDSVRQAGNPREETRLAEEIVPQPIALAGADLVNVRDLDVPPPSALGEIGRGGDDDEPAPGFLPLSVLDEEEDVLGVEDAVR